MNEETRRILRGFAICAAIALLLVAGIIALARFAHEPGATLEVPTAFHLRER